MFQGEELVRFRSDLSREKLFEVIEDSFRRLGSVSIFERGEFEISGGKFKSFATDVKIEGRLSKGRTKGEWDLTINYKVAPSPACWAIVAVGFLFLFLGMLILIIPYQAKSEVQRGVESAVRDAQYEIKKLKARAAKMKPPSLAKVVEYKPEEHDGGVG